MIERRAAARKPYIDGMNCENKEQTSLEKFRKSKEPPEERKQKERMRNERWHSYRDGRKCEKKK